MPTPRRRPFHRLARRPLHGIAAASLAAALLVPTPPADAALPVAALAKQMLVQIVKDQLRSTIESALQNALGAAVGDECGMGGSMASLAGMQGLAGAGGLPFLPSVPGIGALPSLPGLPGLGALPGGLGGIGAGLEALQKLGALASGGARLGAMLSGGAPAGGGMPSADEMARLLQSVPMSAEQRAQAMEGLAAFKELQANAKPTSIGELRAVLADAREVGLLDEEAAADLSGCIASPAAAPMLGMIVPSLRAAVDEARGARQRMAETPVDQRGAVIAEMAAELRAMDAEDRDEAIAALDNPKSPFPGWLRDGVKAAVR